MTQFTDQEGRQTLADFVNITNIYPAGRLDKDSEGLLLLTNDGALQHQLSHPKYKLPKTYWVQVEGIPNAEAIMQLRKGVQLKDGLTRPAEVEIISPPAIWPRTPPIRERANIPTCWISITITEGRNRQVRRMTASIGNPTLRLIRTKIGVNKQLELTLDGLSLGQWRYLNPQEIRILEKL